MSINATARQRDCFDGSDEESCLECRNNLILCGGVGCVPDNYNDFIDTCPFRLGGVFISSQSGGNVIYVELDGSGLFEYEKTHAFSGCGDGLVQCPSGYCIPSFLLGNGEADCPGAEDEATPASCRACPGYYRCQESGACVHPRHVCDKIHHCPLKDDERYCHLSCPPQCRCEGLAAACSAMPDPLHNLHLRYLDLSFANNVSLVNLHFMEFLVFLNLSNCGLDNINVEGLFHLQTLDLSSNSIRNISSLGLDALPNLRYLDLSHNQFLSSLDERFTSFLWQANLGKLIDLRMRDVGLLSMKDNCLSRLVNLKRFDLSQNPSLEYYDKDALSGLLSLQELVTDESKLCCGYFHASFTLIDCRAPTDELSSCDDLLGQLFFRITLWLIACLAVAGNLAVLVYRQFFSKESSSSPAGFLVKNLCASDLLMGVYLLMIGAADLQLRGDYVSREREWRASAACTAAGFLSFLSSEVSAFTVCLVTLDRVLVICFPFKLGLHMSRRAALMLCFVLWVLGVILALVPLAAGLDFYGQTGICVPLPVTRQAYSGQHFAFAVFIVLNFFLFILIGAGQLAIYISVRRTGEATGSKNRQRDMALARRLFLIVFTDFLCWFPIGLMGVLAAAGVPIPGIVNVVAAVLVLPVNSALNPFLYTLNGLRERRREARRHASQGQVLARLRQELARWPAERVAEVTALSLRARGLGKAAVDALLAQVDGAATGTAHAALGAALSGVSCQPDSTGLDTFLSEQETHFRNGK